MKRSIDDPQGYLERIKPIYARLFRTAHAVIGNQELSEYVLKASIVEAYLRRNEWRDRMAFADGLMHTVRSVALVELHGMRAAGAFETDWTKPGADERDAQSILSARLYREPDDLFRMAVLFYGCALTVRQIAFVMQISQSEASGRLRKMNARLLRAVRRNGHGARNAFDTQIESLAMHALDWQGGEVPEMGRVFRSFERDVDGAKKPRRSAWRVLAVVLKALGAVVLAAFIWFVAVLLEPNAPAGSAQTDAMAVFTQNTDIAP